MRSSLITLAASLALLSSGAVSAQTYVGGGLGIGRLAVDCSGTTSCDKTATGGKIYGGYLFGKQLGVELGYVDWGKATATGTVGATQREQPMATTSLTGTLRASGWGLSVAYLVPMSGAWDAALRAGVMQNTGKASIEGIAASVSKHSAQPVFGMGIGYRVSPSIVVTGDLDFSRVKFGAAGTYETDGVHLISFGMRVAF